MIKKLKIIPMLVAFLLFLTACSGEKVVSLTDAEQVLKKSIESMESLKSYSMKMDTEQVMTVNDSETISMFITIEADMTLDPIAFHQKLSMQSDMDMMGTIETEMYLVDDTLVMKEPMSGEWMELPMEFAAEIGALSELQLSPDQQLAALRSFINDIDMTEQGNEYILKLTGDGKEFMELAQLFGGALEGFDEIFEVFSQLDLNSIDYEIYIDKETFYQTRLNLAMDMTMGVEGETIRTQQKISGTVFGYDEVGTITLPTGLLD